ncbi:MAG: oligosaccharide flippase family protein [Oscillatoriophycideae cyanobacterium NC_groundwater_1537_Pr4_S-0.65um_50_18]|nr:oligosaccharide flippase family protein [Oscillatoriophycideae cyanobacterium NC_groundwater_1537_Pr4_S-0.65um_50_18]
MTALKKLVIRGMLWTILGYGASQVLRFSANLILTRLLFPEFFGLMALVNIFIVGLALFSDVGIGINIIQNKSGDEPEFLNTAWTIQVIRGLCLWLICLLIAQPIALLYGEPQLSQLIPVAGLVTVISGFNSTALYTLERHITVKKLTVMELSVQATQITVMLCWAFISPTVWALVGGNIVAALVKLIWSNQLIPGKSNRFMLDKQATREIFSLGRWIFLSTALMFLAEQVDRLLLGKIFSLQLLGVYTVALMLSDVPRQVTVALGTRVVLPAIAKLTDLPRSELRVKALKSRRYLLYALTLVMMVLISWGDVATSFLYDRRYAAAAWMLPILAMGIWPRILCATIEPALSALGKVQYMTFGNLYRLIFTVFGILLGHALFGSLGAVVAVALNDLVYYAIVNYGLCREGIGCLKQDAEMTALLLLGIAAFAAIRLALGIDFPTPGEVL